MTDEARKKRSEYMRKWRKNNKDHLKEYSKEWRELNKEKVKMYNENYWNKKADERRANGGKEEVQI